MKTRKKSLNTYKFESFAQRVSNININVLTQTGDKFHAIPDNEKDTFFRETLEHLGETNCSLDFISLYRELKPLVSSFNLVVYHKDRIVASLKQYLSLDGSFATKACLQLLASLARDLQHDFYSIFKELFGVLIQLLKQKDAELHEDTFICLSYIFKCTWRYMVKEIDDLFKDFKCLLLDSQTHIQLFAAELFAFLIQKSKAKETVIQNLFYEVSKEPRIAVGVGCVIFQTIKGIKYQFVLSVNEILDNCLKMFRIREMDKDEVLVALETTWVYSLKHTKPEYSELLFDSLYRFIEDTLVDGDRHLSYYFNLLNVAVCQKHGYLIDDQSKLFEVLKMQFLSNDLTSEDITALIVLLKSSLEISNLRIDDSILGDVLTNFLNCKKLLVNEKLDTCRMLFQWSKFDEVLKQLILDFISKCLLVEKTEGESSPEKKDIFNFVADLIYKDKKVDEQFCIHSMESSLIQFPVSNSDLVHVHDMLLQQMHVALWESDVQLLWTIGTCLCYCKFDEKDKSIHVFSQMIKHCLQVYGETGENDKLCTLSHCIKSVLILEKEMTRVIEIIPWEDMVDMIKKNPTNEHVLQAFEAYCCFLGKELKQFSKKSINDLYQILKVNVNSPHKLLCLLTLRIFKHLDDQDREIIDYEKENDVFQHCIDAINIDVFISTYQERLTVMRKVVWHDGMAPLRQDVALRFLISNLFLNFSLMWEPVSDLITTHADNRNKGFWDLWLEILNMAADQCTASDLSTDVTLNHYGAFSMCLTSIKSEERVDYKNFRVLLWKAMVKFSDLAERKAKDVIPLYLRFMRDEYCLIDEMIAQKQDLSIKSVPDIVKEDRKSSKKGKVEFQALCAYLKVFSMFKKPKKMEEEFHIYKWYLGFLTSKDSEIQCLAISCLMTYAHPYMTPYKENFDNLMIDSKFRDELMNFTTVNKEDGVINPEHLKSLMPILIRLLYGKLQRRSGLGVSGKSSSSARQNIIMQFLINCSDDEVKPFFEIILEPFQALQDLSFSTSVIEITSIMPLHKQVGFLKMFANLLKKLSTKVEHYLPQLFNALLKVLWTCSQVLKLKDDVHVSYISRVKQIRHLGLVLLNNLFEKELNIGFHDLVTEIFTAAVWPQLSNIVADSAQCATPLLKMFVTWSKNEKYHSLLTVDDEDGRSPISCVFQLLHQKSLSNVIEAFVMTVTLNLLAGVENMDSDVESNGIEMMKPYIIDVLNYISEKLMLKTNRSGKKKQMMKNVLPNIQFSVLSQLSKLVKDTEQSSLIVSILFPLLRCIGSEVTQVHIIGTINNLLPCVEDSARYLDMVPSLFSMVQARAPRQILCHVYLKMTKDEDNVQVIGYLVNCLNSWDVNHLDEPDYDKRLGAFRNINEHVKSGVWNAKQLLPIVHNALHFILTTDDLSLRNAASSCIEAIISLVELEFEQLFSVIILQTIFPFVKSGLKSKKDDVRIEFISLLGLLITTFNHDKFTDMSCLCTHDPETHFFKNLNHIQVHRKIRAIHQLSWCCSEGKISVSNMFFIFMPMITPFIFARSAANKEHNLVSETISAVGCIMKSMPWAKYAHVLKNYLKILQNDIKNRKNTLRLLMVVLDNFHFDLSSLEKKVENAKLNVEKEVEEEEEIAEMDVVHESNDGEEETHEETEWEIASENKILPSDPSDRIYAVLINSIIPQLNRFLKKKGTYDSSKSNYKEIDDQDLLKLPMEFALSQLLQKLPGPILHVNLHGVLLRVSQSLKSHSKEVRESARDILKKISRSLGALYIPMVLKEMKSLLHQGYQRHVLGFTLHSILENMVDVLKSGDLDGIVCDATEIVVDELVGTVGEEKDVSAIANKLHEAQHCKSNATSEIIAKYVSNECIGKIITPIKEVLDSTQNHTNIHKMEEVLFHVANGLQNNESLIDIDMLVFIHSVLSDAMSGRSNEKHENKFSNMGNPADGKSNSYLVPEEPTRGGVTPQMSNKTNNHVLVTFGLHLLNSCLKRQRFLESDSKHVQMLDPIVPLIIANLSSPYNKIMTLSLKCLCYLFKFQLPSTKSSYEMLGKNIFKIMKTFTQAGATKGKDVDLIANSFKAMTILVRDHKDFNITDKQFKILLTLVEEDIHTSSRQVVALPLLKSILSRKVKINLVSEIILKICDLSIRDSDSAVQLHCRKIVLQFLLDYPLGKKIINHFDFYLAHLSYEEETGRISSLEMLTVIINNIPEKLLTEYAGYMFMPLVMMLVNDDSAICRKMCGCTVKLLIQKLNVNVRDDLFNIVTKFYSNNNISLHHVAIQLAGLFAEVEGRGFNRRINTILPLFKETLQKCVNIDDNDEDNTMEKSLYITLNCLVKIFSNGELLGSKENYINQLGEICNLSKSHLLHPHAWIRLTSSQLISLYFASFTPDEWIKKSKESDGKVEKMEINHNIKELCFFFLSQLKDDNLTKEIGNQATKNLIFVFRVVKLVDPRTNAEIEEGTEQTVNSVDDGKKVSVRSLIRKFSQLAAHEAANNPKETKKRLCILRLIASVSLCLGEMYLKDYLLDVLPAIYREMSSSRDQDQDSPLYSLAQQVVELLQGLVNKDAFAEVYGKLQKNKLDRKESKKRKLLTEAITNPSQLALRKQKRNLAKRDQRKRKLDEKKPERKFKKKRVSNDT